MLYLYPESDSGIFSIALSDYFVSDRVFSFSEERLRLYSLGVTSLSRLYQKEFNDKLYAAGLQDIMDAKQEQLDA